MRCSIIPKDKYMKMLENENLEIDVKPIRQRRTIGAIMEIYVDNEYYVYAQSYPYNKEIIFDYRSKEPLKDLSVLLTAKQLFRITVYRSVIGSGHWLKVGKLPLREDLFPLQLQYIHHSYGNIEYEIYNPMTGQITPSTKDECKGLEEAAVWDYGAINERIRDYYNNAPCRWV